MSVNAHLVITQRYAKHNSFNLWHDDKVMDWLGNNGKLDSLNMDCNGQLCLTLSELQELIALLEKDDNEDNLEIAGNLKRDLAWAKKHEYSEVTYDCF